jgi:hypothetical protein
MSEKEAREERITQEPDDSPELNPRKGKHSTSHGVCPDCGAETYPVKLVCTAPYGLGELTSVVRYFADKSAKQGWFSGKFPVKGDVAVEMCPCCGRITLYGISNPSLD